MHETLRRVTALLSVPILLMPGAVPAAEQLVELSSSGREARYSLPPGTREVELVTQRSGTCRFGRTWGYDLSARELWVNGGCGGQFRISSHEPPASSAPDSSNTAAALAAAAAIAGVAILASRGRHDSNSADSAQQQPYYPPANSPGYYPPSAGYHPPQAGYYPPGGGRRGTIHGPGNFCLDVRGGVQQGALAIIFTCHGGGNQIFNWSPRGELMVGNMCLDIAGGSNANGAPVIAFPCNGGRNQQWYVNGAQIQSRQNNKCLDVMGGALRAGTQVIVYDCHGGSNQRWFW